jgi:hypothetical protein
MGFSSSAGSPGNEELRISLTRTIAGRGDGAPEAAVCLVGDVDACRRERPPARHTGAFGAFRHGGCFVKPSHYDASLASDLACPLGMPI